MKLNRKLVMVLALVLSLALATGGTLAYLTDTDKDVNVMTLGSVKIVQNEQMRDENGELVPFENGQFAYPAVGPIDWAPTGKGAVVGGIEYKVFTDELANVIDKIVTVTNTGKSPAYVRTIVAIEAPDYDPNDLIHVNVNITGVSNTAWTPVEIDGVKYVYSVFSYAEALAPGATSVPSLMQLFLDAEATNEDVEKFGDEWEVLVLSQAVQTAGFANPADALDTAFGEANAANVATWMGETEVGSPGEDWPDNNPPLLVNTEEELKAAIAAGKSVMLGGDLQLTDGPILVDGNSDIVLNLNGYTLYDVSDNMTMWVKPGSKLTINGNGTILKSEHNQNMIYYDGELVVENGTFAYTSYTWGECTACAHKTNPLKVGCLFVGRASESKGYKGNLTVNGGTFDSGVTNPEAFVTGNGTNVLMFAMLNNHASTPSEMVVYGGTFIGANPANGDANAPYTLYLEGQTAAGEIPEGYTITESTLADGRTVYTVTYSK